MSETNPPSSDPLDVLSEIPRAEVESGLKILGAPSFVRKGFPLLGLLATVYEHVSTRVGPPQDDPDVVVDTSASDDEED